MSFGIMNITNFAHGTIYMLGGYAMYLFSTVLNLPFFVSVALAIILVGLIGIVFERIVFKPVYNGPELNSLLISLGLLIVLENTVLLLWGSETLSVAAPYSNIQISIFSASVTLQRVIVLISSVFLICLLYAFLNFDSFRQGHCRNRSESQRGVAGRNRHPQGIYVNLCYKRRACRCRWSIARTAFFMLTRPWEVCLF